MRGWIELPSVALSGGMSGAIFANCVAWFDVSVDEAERKLWTQYGGIAVATTAEGALRAKNITHLFANVLPESLESKLCATSTVFTSQLIVDAVRDGEIKRPGLYVCIPERLQAQLRPTSLHSYRRQESKKRKMENAAMFDNVDRTDAAKRAIPLSKLATIPKTCRVADFTPGHQGFVVLSKN